MYGTIVAWLQKAAAHVGWTRDEFQHFQGLDSGFVMGADGSSVGLAICTSRRVRITKLCRMLRQRAARLPVTRLYC
jgi:hypothetical protein